MGQIASFNVAMSDGGRSGTLRDLYPLPPPPNLEVPCAQSGVIGALVGIIGSMQAMEVIKIMTGLGKPLIDKVLVYDGTDNSCKSYSYAKSIACFGETTMRNAPTDCKEIEWDDVYADEENSALVDLRDKSEFIDQQCLRNAINIPMKELEAHVDQLKGYGRVYLYCATGTRSKFAARYINRLFNNAYSIRGGYQEYFRKAIVRTTKA